MGDEFSNKTIEEIVDTLNTFRNELALGNIDGFQSAKRMQTMVKSNKLNYYGSEQKKKNYNFVDIL